jgi:pullulanase
MKRKELGAIYGPASTTFRLWAKSAESVRLCLYEKGDGKKELRRIPMDCESDGTWSVSVEGDLNHIYYNYIINRKNEEILTQDPYAVAAGVNGKRSMVLDLRETDPEGFENDHGPCFKNRTDLVICEISVSDVTAYADVEHPGKYIGLTELSYLKELGITHVQIMPFFDFASIDESDTSKEQYNWGYDPLNYNVPEGSYSTDPFHGEVRIRECKEMIADFHRAGIGVIMDVVYNHTYDLDHCLQKCEPDYFYRKTGKNYSNASGCGNEIASEREMARRYIIDSACFWAKEYHIDGFRFDLMGVLDVGTLNELGERLREINPSIILYGEGWTAGESPLPEYKRAVKKNVRLLKGFGMFSDDIRDAIRGPVFYNREKGFAGGREGLENAIKYCAAGCVWHPQVDYGSYGFSPGGPWADTPEQVINYASCHDNLTLWDRLLVSCPRSTKKERYAMNRLAAAIIFTSQGVPFFLCGEETARTKPTGKAGEVSENSYNLPLFTNALRYDLDKDRQELLKYYKGLIAFRKAHRGLRLSTAEEIRSLISFEEDTPKKVVAFTITTDEEKLFVVYNAGSDEVKLNFPESGEWVLYIDKTNAGFKRKKDCRRSSSQLLSLC